MGFIGEGYFFLESKVIKNNELFELMALDAI